MHPKRAQAYRIQSGALLAAVADETLEPRIAINTWPSLGNEDPSVRCAYTILWYFESDEDRHHQETFYCDVQLGHLAEIAAYLLKGEGLPDHIMLKYNQQEASVEYDNNWTWRELLWQARHWVDLTETVLSSNPLVQRFMKPHK
ncbi:MAG: hypothetical protein R2857_01535 [Vampirovibrionales bacterium]